MKLYGTALKRKQYLSSESHSAIKPMADIIKKTSALKEECGSLENARNSFLFSL
jgi:hypothetical protein